MIKILFLFSSDPAASGRVAEGVRLAAGLAVGHQLQVRLYLHGEAVKALAPDAFSVVDAEVLLQNWPLAAPAHNPAGVQRGMLDKYEIQEPAAPCGEVKLEEIARITEECDGVVHWDADLGPAIFTGDLLAKLGGKGGQHPLILTDSTQSNGSPQAFDLAQPSLNYASLLEALFLKDQCTRL